MSDDALVSLAVEINRAHDDARQCVAQGLEHAHRAGELLQQAKAALPHGQWLPWLAENCEVSERTAQAYMRVAAQWPELEAKAQRVADLPVRQALALLAEPKDTPTAVDSGSAFRTLSDVFDGLCDEADADEAMLDRCNSILDACEAMRPRRKAERVAMMQQLMGVMQDLACLDGRHEIRRLRAEAELSKLLQVAAAEGWPWAQELLAQPDPLPMFLDLCEARVAELEAAT